MAFLQYIQHRINERGRLHVYAPDWSAPGATDYWIGGDSVGALGSAGAGPTLSDYGWTTTSLANVIGSAADFAAKADVGVPGSLGTDGGAGDLLKSPALFGDFVHMDAARYHLGAYPAYLMLEAWLKWGVASNNETTSGFGFIEDGGSPVTAADHLAMMYSDGTNFGLRSGADSDAGAVVQTTPLGLRIRMKPGTTDKVQWFLRTAATGGFVSQGTIDLETDEFPAIFGFGEGTSNTIQMFWAHVMYSLDGKFL